MGMQWNPQFGDIGQYVQGITMGNRGGKEREAARGHYAAGGYGYTYGYGPPAYPPQKPSGYGGGGYPPQPTATGWDDGAYESPPQKPPSYDGYPPQPAAGWDDRAGYKYPPREPPAYGEHPPPPTPPRHPVAWDDGAHKFPPSQQQGKMPGIKPPGTGQEPIPNANNEVEDMPKASPKHEGKPPSAVNDPPRKQPPYGYGHSHPGWGSEGAYYRGSGGGGGYYHPTQARGYPPPCLPPPYQAGGHGGGYGGAHMGWPVPAPPSGAYAAYGAYHKHHGGGYGGSGYGGGGYGNGKYMMGHQGKFKQYAHHHGQF
ncbi:unnamed protein product [Urochloa decumbens]|uniref:Uncharacterized protein n=1 Tax=Urochloa decumbens TaxID=240449 RepID=A0ABC8YYB9_9POAL